MTSTISKISCVICNRNNGQFRCEGCSQTFCMKHVVEHRQGLNQQLNEIIIEHDTLQQLTNDNRNQHKFLINSIEQWEQKSIEKIRQLAKEIREKVTQLVQIDKKSTGFQQLKNLTQQIKTAQQDENFFEQDLQQWKSIVNKVNDQLKTVSLSNHIHENKTLPLIYPIQLSAVPSKLKSLERTTKAEPNYYEIESDMLITTERFSHCYGNAKIEQNGQLVTNGNDSFFGTEIRGNINYIYGIHEIRLQVRTNPSQVCIFIGIISKQTPMGGNLFTSSSVYGWADYNDYFLAGHRQKTSSDVLFLYTRENDIIQLTIDCSKQIIHYTNKRNRKDQEICVDINKCPFPWQLYISLGGKGDQLCLVNNTTTL